MTEFRSVLREDGFFWFTAIREGRSIYIYREIRAPEGLLQPCNCPVVIDLVQEPTA